MAFKQKGFPMQATTSALKQKTDPKSKIDIMIEMEMNKDYSGWEGSDAAKFTGRTAEEEHQLTLKQLAEMKEKEKFEN